MHTPCTRQRVGGGQRQTPFCDSGPVRSRPPSQPPSQPAASSSACSQTYRARRRELMRHVVSAWYVWRVVCGAWCVERARGRRRRRRRRRRHTVLSVY
eukprot:scaffold59223_cov48-Phaeocystis_antarctica.AAC.5